MHATVTAGNALTRFWFFSQLATGGRSVKATCRIIQELATDAVRRRLGGTSRGANNEALRALLDHFLRATGRSRPVTYSG